MTLDISQKVRTDLREVAGSASNRRGNRLESVQPRGALPAQRGLGEPRRAETVGGAGIASPLVEQPDTREYYDAVLRPSTDGAVFFSVRATKTIIMKDANGEDVVMEYQNVTG